MTYFKDTINRHCHGKPHVDIEAARRVHQSEMKSDLVEDPFIHLFEYGNAEEKEGYWNYDYIFLQ
eukprot:8020963-Ditylum_brightwellii.AAC.1